jgi:hypothetical protein
MTAPAHMGQGSSVTYIAQPSSLQLPRSAAGFPHGQQLRVGGGVAGLLAAVAAAADYFPARAGDHAAHRHLARGGGLPRPEPARPP